MANELIVILIPLIGYIGLWLLGIVFFLIYFKLFRISMDYKHPLAIVKRLPSALAIATVPICSFVSFFITTKVVLAELHLSLSAIQLLPVGITSLLFTIILDLLITVLGEKIDIRSFPLNLMYLLAWFVIVPAIILAILV